MKDIEQIKEILTDLVERSHQGVASSVSGLGSVVLGIKNDLKNFQNKVDKVIENQNQRLMLVEDEIKIHKYEKEKLNRNSWIWRILVGVMISIVGFYALKVMANTERVSLLEVEVIHNRDTIEKLGNAIIDIQTDIKTLLQRSK